MKQKLYNSKYEIQPRLMLLTSVEPNRLYTEDQLIAYDFMAVYAKEFHEQGQNLHGDNGFKFSEFAARKQAVSESIKALVRLGMLKVELQDGFKYSASEEGIQLYQRMESNYANEYKKQLVMILERYKDSSETDLHKLIRKKSIKEV